LYSSELDLQSASTRGYSAKEASAVGKVISDHPINRKKFNYEHLLALMRRLGLEQPLQLLRGERAIMGRFSNLEEVTSKTDAISGGYIPLIDRKIFSQLDLRFKKANLPSPFSTILPNEHRYEVVIHYRIGDKKSRYSSPGTVGTDGVIDPSVFNKLCQKLLIPLASEIYVLSDEPKVAVQLLQSVGISAVPFQSLGTIWEDLHKMSRSHIFLGTWSQVSHLGASLVASNGARGFIPASSSGGGAVGLVDRGVVSCNK
jgi:hypothetical protein